MAMWFRWVLVATLLAGPLAGALDYPPDWHPQILFWGDRVVLLDLGMQPSIHDARTGEALWISPDDYWQDRWKRWLDSYDYAALTLLDDRPVILFIADEPMILHCMDLRTRQLLWSTLLPAPGYTPKPESALTTKADHDQEMQRLQNAQSGWWPVISGVSDGHAVVGDGVEITTLRLADGAVVARVSAKRVNVVVRGNVRMIEPSRDQLTLYRGVILTVNRERQEVLEARSVTGEALPVADYPIADWEAVVNSTPDAWLWARSEALQLTVSLADSGTDPPFGFLAIPDGLDRASWIYIGDHIIFQDLGPHGFLHTDPGEQLRSWQELLDGMPPHDRVILEPDLARRIRALWRYLWLGRGLLVVGLALGLWLGLRGRRATLPLQRAAGWLRGYGCQLLFVLLLWHNLGALRYVLVGGAVAFALLGMWDIWRGRESLDSRSFFTVSLGFCAVTVVFGALRWWVTR